MSLLVDRHRPATLAKLTLHPDVTTKLQSLARSEELPHLMFYGPSGTLYTPMYIARYIIYRIHTSLA